MEVLVCLAENQGQLVSKEQLMQTVWANTFVTDDVLTRSISELRKSLEDDSKESTVIQTIPRKGYRLIAAVQPVTKARRHNIAIIVPVAVAALALSVGAYYFHRTPKLTDRDTIVLADFTNTTGDSVFDGTLRQGLAVQLEQSPFLSLISEERIQQTLRLMGKSPEARLTAQIARDVCQRTESAALLESSITSFGSQYVLGLKAVNCRTGDLLAQEQVTADRKEQVLKALGRAAVSLRTKLGESLRTVEKYDISLEQATTPSLEALQAYSLGWKSVVRKGDPAAAGHFFQRAIHLDPNFAMAYASLGAGYGNLGETNLAAENLRKAYQLRDRVSARERFAIESDYDYFVTGNLEKSRQTNELWAQTYPRDWMPANDLAAIYADLGLYDKRLVEKREALRLAPASAFTYATIVSSYLWLNRVAEARTTAEEALARNLDSSLLHIFLYNLAFLQNDATGMAQQLAWSADQPGVEDSLLASEADTAAYFGRLVKARELSRQAAASAERAGEKETAAAYEAIRALRESLFGNVAEAQQRAARALALSPGRDVQYGAALALVFAGDAARARAEKLSDDLAMRFPEDTIVQFSYLPTIRAQLALSRNNEPKAIEALQTSVPYELGCSFVNLYPVYVRGDAYLAAHRGREAAAEFQKILDHRGIVLNGPIGALAHLGLGRAYALSGDTTKARTAYKDFLTLWKDADPDIPILKQAKTEYAKLQ